MFTENHIFEFKLKKLKIFGSYLHEKNFMNFLKSQNETLEIIETDVKINNHEVLNFIINEIPNVTTLWLDSLNFNDEHPKY